MLIAKKRRRQDAKIPDQVTDVLPAPDTEKEENAGEYSVYM